MILSFLALCVMLSVMSMNHQTSYFTKIARRKKYNAVQDYEDAFRRHQLKTAVVRRKQ
jgi:hypothetical protein